jgi:hypothetical protein
MGIKRTMRFGEHFTHENFNFTVYLRSIELYNRYSDIRKFYFTVNDPNTLALSYKSKVTVTLNDKKGSLLTLSSSGYVAAQEADYLNKLMEVYIRRGWRRKTRLPKIPLGLL